MGLQTKYLRVNVSDNTVRTWGDKPIDAVEVFHGDDVLYAFWFRETYVDGDGRDQERDLDLSSGLTVVRYDCDDRKGDQASAADLAYQDSYNQQSDATIENLAGGKISLLVSYTAATIATALGTGNTTAAWHEIAIVKDTYNQTLMQGQITIHEQLNDSAGTPSTPAGTFSTTAESNILYLESDNVEDPADTTQLTIQAGLHQVKHTGAGALNLVLVDPAEYDTALKRETWVRGMSLSTGTIVFTVAGGSNIVSAYATSASYTINAQSMADLVCDGTNWLVIQRQA